MTQSLPIGWFEFLRQDDINYFNANIIRENNEEHCVLEVDLKYTKELYGLHNDHFFAPKQILFVKGLLVLRCVCVGGGGKITHV